MGGLSVSTDQVVEYVAGSLTSSLGLLELASATSARHVGSVRGFCLVSIKTLVGYFCGRTSFVRVVEEEEEDRVAWKSL